MQYAILQFELELFLFMTIENVEKSPNNTRAFFRKWVLTVIPESYQLELNLHTGFFVCVWGLSLCSLMKANVQ